MQYISIRHKKNKINQLETWAYNADKENDIDYGYIQR
jgi:hypothetical protein